VLVEGESLLNDGTAVVFLSIILAYVSGMTASPVRLIGEFIVVAGGGAVAGYAVGVVVTQIIRRVDDAMIEITLTTIAAYGSFALADNLRVSGVIATVVAGMLCGNYGRRVAMSPTTRAAVESFWEYVAFALNSMVFLLLGFEVSFAALVASWREIIIAYFAVLATRVVVVLAGRLISRMVRTPGTVPAFSWSIVLVWGGLRGALSLVLALALSPALANRQLVVRMTAGVVVLTLLVQGLTMAPLVEYLRLSGSAEHES
jgi:monovalent cation:H+ antiporter, CPA1 family